MRSSRTGVRAWLGTRGAKVALAVVATLALTVGLALADRTRLGTPTDSGEDVPQLGWVAADRAFDRADLTALALVNPRKSGASSSVRDPALPDGPLLVNVWATWCAPCRAEMPLLQQYAADPDRSADVVGISRDVNTRAARSFLAERRVRFPSYLDEGFALTESLRPTVPFNVVPTSFLVVGDRITAVHVGEFHSVAEIESEVRERLPEPAD